MFLLVKYLFVYKKVARCKLLYDSKCESAGRERGNYTAKGVGVSAIITPVAARVQTRHGLLACLVSQAWCACACL